MVDIRLSDAERLMHANMKIGQMSVDLQVLDAALTRCVSLMTPEQLVGAGLSAPTPLAQPETIDSGLVMGGPDDNTEKLLGKASKNGHGAAADVLAR